MAGMKDSPNLDLLRAIAVALVVLSHLPQFAPAGFSTNALGHVGVAIFFVHTTLVLMQSLERHGHAPLPFYVRRAFRIYPLSMWVVLLLAMVGFTHGAPMDWHAFLSNLLLVQNITGAQPNPAPLWTLPYELQMYLVLPALFLLARSRRALAGLGLVLAACLALAAVRGNLQEPTLVNLAPCFLPGALAYILPRGNRSPLLLWAVVAIGALAIPMASAAGIAQIPLLWALCLALGVVIPCCREITNQPLQRGAKTVATYSYGIYVMHVFAIEVAFGGVVFHTHAAQWIAFGVLLALLPAVGYHLIEKKGIALGARLATQLRSRLHAPRPAAGISSPLGG
jgi:peptidoglycan/LPS O-acetylase OafA/YrhL